VADEALRRNDQVRVNPNNHEVCSGRQNRGMPIDERNPFDPDFEGPPLRLTLESRSLSRLRGREAEEAEFLSSLCDADEIDGLVTWAREGFAANVPAAVMKPGRHREDSVAAGMLGEPDDGFIGVIPHFGQWERLGEQLQLGEADCQRLIHTGPALAFHQSSKRHLFVCGDRALLAQRGKPPFTNLWRGIFSIRETLALVGAALRARGKIYEEVRGGYSSAITNYGVRFNLAVEAMPNRRRLAQWLRSQDPKDERVQAMDSLQNSLHLRATELLRAREGVEREEHRFEHNNATADEALYHLRAAVAALAAGCDGFASLAALALALPPERIGDPLRVGISQKAFRKALKTDGLGAKTDQEVSQATPMLALVKAFRDPIVHQAGPSGSTVHHAGTPAFTESKISSLSEEQVAAISGLGGRAAQWGLQTEPPWPSLSPLPFVTRLATDGIAMIDALLCALATDLELEPLAEINVVEPRKLARLRLLSGMDPLYDGVGGAR
jgi:hypothetical protein